MSRDAAPADPLRRPAAGRLLWLALWCAVLGWDALLPHLGAPAPRLAAAALVAAGVGLAAALRRGAARPPSLDLPDLSLGLHAVLVAAGGLAALALPHPERLGALLVAAGSGVALVPRLRAAWGGAPSRALGVLGGLVLLLAATSHVYRIAEAALHDLDVLARPLAAAFRLLGVEAAADPPFVSFQGVGRLYTLDASLEKLVGHALASYAVAALALLAGVHGRRLGWRRPLALIGMGLGYGGLRFLVLGLVLDQGAPPAVFWDRGWVMGSLLPLVALWAAVLPPARASAPRLAEPLRLRVFGTRRAVAALVAGGAAGLLAAAAFGLHDPGRPKHGRVLIDERHSNWEWSTIRLDTESYGVQTVYNYSELVRYLGHFHDIEANFVPLTDSLLATCAVLVLKTPTRPYDDAEVDAVVRFVEGGGGLWLIGDHTNVFGMGTNLNKIARRFGIRLRYDAVIDLATFGRQLYERPRRFAHPVVRHVPPLLMATSCSVVGPPFGERVMLGRSLLSDELDYSVNTFFGNFRADPSEPFGAMLQSVAVSRGKGRVLVFTDSTIFSNFFMFVRGKPELALGSIDWLMRSNRLAGARPWLAAAALVAAAAFLAATAALPRGVALAAAVLAALPAFALAAFGLDRWVAGWSQPSAPRTPLPLVAFDRGRTAWDLPDIEELPDRTPLGYHTFYVWTQRVGRVPTTRLFEDCLTNSDAVVLVNPREHFSASEVAALRDYVRGGAGLLVLDSPRAHHSTANTLLAPFGLAFEYAAVESVTVYDVARGDSVCVLGRAGGVRGGEPVLRLPDGRSVLATARQGEGRVVALCAADDFSDAVLGTTSEVPTPEQLALYRLEYRIFDELLPGGRPAAALAPPSAPVLAPPGAPGR